MKKLSLSLLATTILSTAATQAYAAKEPEIYFHPAKTWTVGHASDNSTTCAVQSEFNNGFVLQFDGDKAVQSFTVNFRQNIFKEGQPYNVALTVPGKQTRQFSATATGPTMLTIPLQNAGDIYSAARDTAAIDVAIDENNFRFYLINFAPAAQSFETCMQTGKLAPAQQAAPQPAAAPAPAAKQAQQQPPQRDVSNAIPQGNTAPPPPNGSAAKIQTTATLNESIALEQKEASAGNVPITEILPNNPEPSVHEIPYTETVKLGDQVVEKNGKVIESEQQAAAAIEAEMPKGQNPNLRPEPQPRGKRMSEQLAEQMETNPGIMAGQEPQAGIPQQQASKAAAVESVEQEAMPPAEQPQQIAKSPIPAPPPVETKQAEAPKQPEPQPVETAELQPHPSSMPSEVRAMQAQRPMPETAAEPAPSGNEPFAGHGEFIDTDKPGKPARQAAKQPEPQPIAEPAPVKQASIEHKETPPPVVHKETHEMDADFTQFDNMEPASREDIGEPFQSSPSNPRKADPDMLRKISELEIQVSKLSKENNELNSELQTNLQSAEQERVSISSDNWNLERATMRYNEAERQIKRMGEQIQRERALCQGDKKDLEAQLFDPKITEQQQLARLADLEQKLADAQQQLEDQRMRYEDRIKILQSHSATQ